MFGDQLDGFDRIFLSNISEKQSGLLQQVRATRGEAKKRTKTEATEDFCQYVVAEAEKMIAHDEQYCSRCKKKCPIYPRAFMRAQDVWIDCVSSTCTAWSTQGTKFGWLCPSNLPLICWAAAARNLANCPDLSFLECTPQLPLGFLTRLSKGRLNFHSCIRGPKDAGIATSGRRVWAVAAANNLCYKENPFSSERLTKAVLRKVVGDPSMFIHAMVDEITSFLDFLKEHRDKLPSHQRGRRYQAEEYIGSSAAGRLHFHRFQAAQVRIQDPTMLIVRFYMDISQNVTWTSKPDGTLPRQLTSSLVWVEDLERPMAPRELMAAQGPG